MTIPKLIIKGANKASKRRSKAVVMKNGNKITTKSLAAVRSENRTKRAKYRADRDTKTAKYKYTSRATLYGSAGAASAANDASSSSQNLEDAFNQTKPQGDIHTDTTPGDQSQRQIQTFEPAETSTNPAPTSDEGARKKASDEEIWGRYHN